MKFRKVYFLMKILFFLFYTQLLFSQSFKKLNLAIEVTGKAVSCFGVCDGIASVNVTGGTPPYNYLWSPFNETDSAIYNLCTGTYTVTVTDNLGFSESDTIFIEEPNALNLYINNVIHESAPGMNNGSATVSVSGGTPPYNYNWNPSFQDSSTATGLSAGTHYVTVTDSNGCTTTEWVDISTTTGVLNISFKTEFAFFPNPANEEITLKIEGNIKEPRVEIYDISGRKLKEVSNIKGNEVKISLTNLSKGVYFVKLVDKEGKEYFVEKVIVE